MPRSENRKPIELPLELHRQLKEVATQQGITTTTAAVIAVREWLARQLTQANESK